MVESGFRDNNFKKYGRIISRKTNEHSVVDGRSYRIIYNNKKSVERSKMLMVKKVNWICNWLLQLFTVMGLAMLHGVRLKNAS